MMARMLFLSASLHLALLMLVQPTRVRERAATEPIVVRLNFPEPAPRAAGEQPHVASLTQDKPHLIPKTHPPIPVPPAKAIVDHALPSLPMAIDPTWYAARQLDLPPRPRHPVQVDYPPDARAHGLAGVVKLRLKIDEFGSLQEAVIEESDPPGVFDAAVLDAYRAAVFVPGKVDQRPVRAEIEVRVVFSP